MCHRVSASVTALLSKLLSKPMRRNLPVPARMPAEKSHKNLLAVSQRVRACPGVSERLRQRHAPHRAVVLMGCQRPNLGIWCDAWCRVCAKSRKLRPTPAKAGCRLDGDSPVVIWDHEWIETDKEIVPLYSSARKLFECQLFFVETDVAMHEWEESDPSEVHRGAVERMLAIDPGGLGGPGRRWLTSFFPRLVPAPPSPG